MPQLLLVRSLLFIFSFKFNFMRNICLFILVAFVLSCSYEKTTVSDVKWSGAMKNVMKKGELFGTIHLDTISNKKHLYGLGPIEYLSGEITVFDGKSYVSTVNQDSTMTVTQTFDVKAPFFVYANVENWTSLEVPKSVVDLVSLEAFLTSLPNSDEKPFAFKIETEVAETDIHVVNLPKHIKTVSSHDEAHQGQVNYILNDKKVNLIGFYSAHHHAVFTHHDTNLHVHLIIEDEKDMGHVESVSFKKLKLWISK
jgi:acetolactate decarboxylase